MVMQLNQAEADTKPGSDPLPLEFGSAHCPPYPSELVDKGTGGKG